MCADCAAAAARDTRRTRPFRKSARCPLARHSLELTFDCLAVDQHREQVVFVGGVHEVVVLVLSEMLLHRLRSVSSCCRRHDGAGRLRRDDGLGGRGGNSLGTITEVVGGRPADELVQFVHRVLGRLGLGGGVFISGDCVGIGRFIGGALWRLARAMATRKCQMKHMFGLRPRRSATMRRLGADFSGGAKGTRL